MPPRRRTRASTVVSLAPRGLPPATKSKLLRLLMLGHSPHDVAYECRCHLATVYRYINNILTHGSVNKPLVRTLGRPRTLSRADEDALFDMLVSEGWRFLDEIRFWLWCERNALVSLSTISRILKRREWNKKKLYLIGRGRSEELRDAWRLNMRRYTAEGLDWLGGPSQCFLHMAEANLVLFLSNHNHLAESKHSANQCYYHFQVESGIAMILHTRGRIDEALASWQTALKAADACPGDYGHEKFIIWRSQDEWSIRAGRAPGSQALKHEPCLRKCCFAGYGTL